MGQNKTKKIKNINKRHTEKDNSIKTNKKPGLTLGMIRIIIVCLLIPYLSLSVVLFYFSTIKANNRVSETVITSMENAAELCNINIETCIEASKKASYDGVIKESYSEFQKTNDESKMYDTVSSYLDNTYRHSSAIANTILLFNRKTSLQYYTYSNIAGSTYADISYFKANALPAIAKASKNLDTKTRFVIVEDNLYIIRHIMTSDYVPFSTLVMEINVDHMFKSMENIVWRQGGILFIDGELLSQSDEMKEEQSNELMRYAEYNVLQSEKINEENLKNGETFRGYDMDEEIAYLTMNVNGQKITYVQKMDRTGILNEQGLIIYAYILIIILLIPLLYATFKFFYNNVSKPISDLMMASGKIEKGEYGYRMEEFEKNEEFGTLINTFNHMSVSLEESFNRIYAEEIALRDANMQALQSQINPHFLNNTLEIINWKARISGNDDVSGMIESLGIMMEATMNRKNEPFITIREEMKYVEAYLYIIVQRFGEKFQFAQQIDESVMDMKIPRLIIQPLVENMVEHGGDKYGNRQGRLNIFVDKKYLHIVVENNGNIKPEDKKKIEKLLDSDKIEKNMHNIGIRNVNLRLKMLYGEESSLIITNPESNLTISEIIIEKDKLMEQN